MGGASFEILLLLAVAVFLLVRLIGVLGTRDGFEPDQNAASTAARPKPALVVDNEEDFDVENYAGDNEEIAEALSQAKRVEPDFRVAKFFEGAKRAHEMILGAFMKGDIAGIKPFVDSELYAGFEAAIAERQANGQQIEAKFLGYRNVSLDAAEFDAQNRELSLVVCFEAELNRVVKDSEGNVIEGDMKTLEMEIDRWEFTRQMGAGNPNWLLVSTDG